MSYEIKKKKLRAVNMDSALTETNRTKSRKVSINQLRNC
jgi:hypothetical protein